MGSAHFYEFVARDNRVAKYLDAICAAVFIIGAAAAIFWIYALYLRKAASTREFCYLTGSEQTEVCLEQGEGVGLVYWLVLNVDSFT